jgi:hypothetical protein
VAQQRPPTTTPSEIFQPFQVISARFISVSGCNQLWLKEFHPFQAFFILFKKRACQGKRNAYLHGPLPREGGGSGPGSGGERQKSLKRF